MRSPTLPASSGSSAGSNARGPTRSSGCSRADRRGFAQSLQQITRGRAQPGASPVPSADAAAPTPHRPRRAHLRVRDRAGARDPTRRRGCDRHGRLALAAARCGRRRVPRLPSRAVRPRAAPRHRRVGAPRSRRARRVPGAGDLRGRPPAPRAGGERALRAADGDLSRAGAAHGRQGLARRARRRPRPARGDRSAAPRRPPRIRPPRLRRSPAAAGGRPSSTSTPSLRSGPPSPPPTSSPSHPPGAAADRCGEAAGAGLRLHGAPPPVAGLSSPRPHRVCAAGRRPAAPPAPADASDARRRRSRCAADAAIVERDVPPTRRRCAPDAL